MGRKWDPRASNVGGVSNVDIDGNNARQIKAIGVVISTFETLPYHATIFSALLAHAELRDNGRDAARLTQVPPVVWRHIPLCGRSEMRLSSSMRLGE
jgi:hypothetical protein